LAGVRHSATDSKDKLGDKAGRQVSKVVNGKRKRETKWETLGGKGPRFPERIMRRRRNAIPPLASRN